VGEKTAKMVVVLLLLLLLLAVLVLGFRNLLSSVILLGVFSLICALLFFVLKAPDLAIAEAAVGAGLATALFVQAVRKTGNPEN
jgi:energy-converting hydrogenase B subunit D